MRNGVVVLTNGSQLPDGIMVDVTTVQDAPGPSLPAPGQMPPYPVSEEQRKALLELSGLWKLDHPPNDEDVERIIEEHRMKKYG